MKATKMKDGTFLLDLEAPGDEGVAELAEPAPAEEPKAPAKAEEKAEEVAKDE